MTFKITKGYYQFHACAINDNTACDYSQRQCNNQWLKHKINSLCAEYIFYFVPSGEYAAKCYEWVLTFIDIYLGNSTRPLNADFSRHQHLKS